MYTCVFYTLIFQPRTNQGDDFKEEESFWWEPGKIISETTTQHKLSFWKIAIMTTLRISSSFLHLSNVLRWKDLRAMTITLCQWQRRCVYVYKLFECIGWLECTNLVLNLFYKEECRCLLFWMLLMLEKCQIFKIVKSRALSFNSTQCHGLERFVVSVSPQLFYREISIENGKGGGWWYSPKSEGCPVLVCDCLSLVSKPFFPSLPLSLSLSR